MIVKRTARFCYINGLMSSSKPVKPKSQTNLSQYSQSKRQQIVDGAVRVFLEYGYADTSMNRVAEESGVIKQTIYSHFSDKEGLFRAIIETLTLEHFRSEFGENLDFNEPPDVVLRKIGAVFMKRKDDPSYIALMRTVIGESARFPELARLYVNTVIGPAKQALSSYLAAQKQLNITEPEATARIYCGSIVSYIMTQEVLHGKEIIPFDSDRLLDTLIEMIMNQRK